MKNPVWHKQYELKLLLYNAFDQRSLVFFRHHCLAKKQKSTLGNKLCSLFLCQNVQLLVGKKKYYILNSSVGKKKYYTLNSSYPQNNGQSFKYATNILPETKYVLFLRPLQI